MKNIINRFNSLKMKSTFTFLISTIYTYYLKQSKKISWKTGKLSNNIQVLLILTLKMRKLTLDWSFLK